MTKLDRQRNTVFSVPFFLYIQTYLQHASVVLHPELQVRLMLKAGFRSFVNCDSIFSLQTSQISTSRESSNCKSEHGTPLDSRVIGGLCEHDNIFQIL